MKKNAFELLIAIIFLSSCTYNNVEELYPDEVCDTSIVTYNQDIKPIFEESCYYCHSSSVEYYGNLNLENFEHIKRIVDNGELLKNIKQLPDSKPMPQNAGKLSDCKIAKIENWINQGIPNN